MIEWRPYFSRPPPTFRSNDTTTQDFDTYIILIPGFEARRDTPAGFLTQDVILREDIASNAPRNTLPAKHLRACYALPTVFLLLLRVSLVVEAASASEARGGIGVSL